MIPLKWICSNCEESIIADQVEEMIILIDIHKCDKIAV